MTLFERLRLWLTPAGRDIGRDRRIGEAIYTAAYDDIINKGARAWERYEAKQSELELFVDPIADKQAALKADAIMHAWANDGPVTDMDDTTLDDWEDQGGQPPPGQVPNCS